MIESYVPQPDLIDHDHEEWLDRQLRAAQKLRLVPYLGQEAVNRMEVESDLRRQKAHEEFVRNGIARQEAARQKRELRETRVASLASQFHENWRKTRMNEQGEYEPRIKPTTDNKWIESHGDAATVDIANTPFEDLPKDWQAENRAAAEVVVDAIDRNKALYGDFDLNKPHDRLAIMEEIHDMWLARNEWAKGSELDVGVDDLSTAEQAKDLRQAEQALEIFDDA